MTSSITAQKNRFPGAAFYLSVLVIFAAALSISVWMGQSIRLDEAQSVWQTSRSLGGVMNVIAKDVHTPLYFIGLHYWEVLFGTSAFAIRLLSLLFFAVSIPAVFMLARETYSNRVAYFSALITAVSPFLNWYGSEARMYSLLFLCATLSHLLFMRLWRTPSRASWIAFAAITFIGIFTQPFFLFLALVQVGFFAAQRRLFPRTALKNMIIVGAVIGAAGIAWAVYRSLAGAGLSNPVLSRPTTVDLFNVFSNFFIGFQTDGVNTFYLSLWPIAVFVGFTFLSRKRPYEPQTAYLAAASFVPILLAFITSIFIEPLFLSRYLIICLPSLYLLAAYFLSSYRGIAGDMAISAVAVMMLGMLVVQAVQPLSPVKEDWRSAAEYVQAHAAPSDLFVVSAPFITYPVEYYYAGSARLATFPGWNRFTRGSVPDPYSDAALAQNALQWSSVYDRVYLLLGYDQGYEEKVRLYMDKHYQRVSEQTFSPGLSLYVYQLRYL